MKLLKKLFPLFVVLNLNHAYAETINPSLITGPYALLGVSNLSHTDTLEISNWDNNYIFFRGTGSGNNLGLTVLLGYQQLWGNIILGGNGAFRYFVGPTTTSVKLNAINTPRIQANTNLGLELRPGYLILPNVSLFGIIGYESMYYKVGHLFNQTNTTFSGWQHGLGLGVGSEVALSKRFSLQLDFMYISLTRLKYVDQVSKTNVVVYPTTTLFTLGLKW